MPKGETRPPGRPKGATRFPDLADPQKSTIRVRIPEDEQQVLGKNHVRIFSVSRNPIIKKIYPNVRFGRRNMYQEIYASTLAASMGINTPEIEGWNSLRHHPYTLFKYIETVTPPSKRSPDLWFAIGNTAAKIHQIKPDHHPVLELNRQLRGTEVTITPTYPEYFKSDSQIIDAVEAIRKRSTAMGEAAQMILSLLSRANLDDHTQPLVGLMHGNMLPEALLYGADGKLYVRDWHNSFFTDTRVEAAIILHRARMAGGKDASDSYLTGYSSGGCDPAFPENIHDTAVCKYLIDQLSAWSINHEVMNSQESPHPRTELLQQPLIEELTTWVSQINENFRNRSAFAEIVSRIESVLQRLGEYFREP